MTRMRPKLKSSEPSLRDKLTEKFIEALEADWQQHGTEIIQRLREKHPERYADIVARLTTPIEPPPVPASFHAGMSQSDIALRMLRDLGVPDGGATPSMIEAATEAQLLFVATLERIAKGN